MQDDGNIISRAHDRRSFLKTGFAATGAATVGTALLARATAASAQTGSLTDRRRRDASVPSGWRGHRG